MQTLNLSCKELYLLNSCLEQIQQEHSCNRNIKDILYKVKTALNNELSKMKEEYDDSNKFKTEYDMRWIK